MILGGGHTSYLYICYRIVENVKEREGVTRLTREASRAFLRLRGNSWESSGLIGNYFWIPESLGLGLRVMVAACRCFNKALPNVEGVLKLRRGLVFGGSFHEISFN